MKPNKSVILATPLTHPQPSKALSDTVFSLSPEKRPDFYQMLASLYATKAKPTVADLPEPYQTAVVTNYPNG